MTTNDEELAFRVPFRGATSCTTWVSPGSALHCPGRRSRRNRGPRGLLPSDTYRSARRAPGILRSRPCPRARGPAFRQPRAARRDLRPRRRRRRHQRARRGVLLTASGRPAARILILDNHDDFGGHAKRNEFHQGGPMRLACGGTVEHRVPARTARRRSASCRDLGIDIPRLRKDYGFNWLGLAGRLKPALLFDKATIRRATCCCAA